jgi:hypothetical protein
MQAVKVNIRVFGIVLLMGISASIYGQEIEYITDFRILPKLVIHKNLANADSLKINFALKTRTFNVNSLPFFCKIEHKMSAKARIPVRFRLGSLDYVNKLEGKGH